jgi:uncharacterized protein YdeI (YjbR/CyaY-like superfamily)
MAAKRGTESNPIFFKSVVEYRAWLEKNHESVQELWIGYWKKATGKPSMTWNDTVDESLCFGWIDGIRKSIDADSFKQRVTPRRATSIWSEINIRKVAALVSDGRMRPAGLAAFEKRDQTRKYSYEQLRATLVLGPEREAKIQKNRKAWEFFQKQPPGYKRLATWYVMSAKLEPTREKRLARVIRESAAGRRLVPMAPKKKN